MSSQYCYPTTFQHWLNIARTALSVDPTRFPSASSPFALQRWPHPIAAAPQQINLPITPSKTQPLPSPDIKDRVHRPRTINLVTNACAKTPSLLPLGTPTLDQVAAMHPAFQTSNGSPLRSLSTRMPRVAAAAAIPLATVKL
ncbi:hypothetical protein M407DRAFT_33472 [Tulasnella calospora MUT 4182]|uniref:Uncharacterized protein n=1 Tax=Tulasnella calospora MUT 4182 TaxID=1051891 RepID=A0A0C3Q2A1_9AGAM|nr:hypothetical protein M407DRAFT_33472 [Tulasnella calospora MUT 4182]